MLVQKHLVGFDLDGVIIDSEYVMNIAWKDVCKSLDLKIPFIQYRKHIGKPFTVILLELGLYSKRNEISSIYFKSCKANENLIKKYEEVTNLIDMLKMQNIGTSIVTSKPRERTIDLLKRLNIEVDIVICPEDCSRGKPFGDPLIIVQKFFSLRPDQCIYIGDMSSDYKAAMNAGWDFIFAQWGYGNINNSKNMICCKTADKLKMYIEDQCNVKF